MDKTWLKREYLTLKKSVRQIRKDYGYGTNTLKRWLRFYNIPIRQNDHPIVRKQMARGGTIHGKGGDET